jgi:hypothetical protein
MKTFSKIRRGIASAIIASAFSMTTQANEGMWLFNDPPRQLLKSAYDFDTESPWLEHLQQSSVRFNNGGSGSFVSEDGLIISNHHVGADSLQKFGDPKHNYMRDGFHARTHAEEKKCLDLELNVLLSMTDVTARVNAAVKPEMSADQAFAARRSVMAAIEKESTDKTGLRSDVVTLYQGGLYHLYCYKKYTDVRLVFAPEQQIAFYGGDPDNFEYPRFNLDICLFRAYENGKPAKIQHFLKWSAAGVSENELVFVSGHPGNTSRMLTMAELEYQRDFSMPYRLQYLHRLEVMLNAYSGRSQESARRARETLFGVQNSRKAREGMQAGLLDPQLMEIKRAAEQKLRDLVANSDDFKEARDAWSQIEAAQNVLKTGAREYAILEAAHGFHSTLFHIARTLLRSVEESPKPNGERLREYRDSNRESLELELFSEEPIYDDFERIQLADSLGWMCERLGFQTPMVQDVLQGKSPRERAAQLIAGSHLKDVATRKRYYSGTAPELEKAADPMIELARKVDARARELRKIAEAQEEIKKQAYAKIAKARFAADNAGNYPDATFTLRLAFGTASGYEEDGQKIPFQTTVQGLYDRSALHENQPPFDLPQRWLNRKSKLSLATPFNFVCTADIIGGNSGSPVVNRRGEFVGIIFDGNIQSLILDYLYTEKQARAVSVCSQSILEALRTVYDAAEIADELTGKNRPN